MNERIVRVTPRSPAQRLAAICLLAIVALGQGGCNVGAFLFDSVEPYVTPPVIVEAEYKGLEGQRVAVLVDADPSILFEHPLTQYQVASIVSTEIARNVPNVLVIDARQVNDFQQRNIYWNTAPHAEIAQRLNVSRLVLIDVNEYRLHQPGNVNIFRGVINALVRVAEADRADSNTPSYSTTVTVAYPPQEPMGVLNAETRTIELGTLDLFARGVAGKFYERQERRTKS